MDHFDSTKLNYGVINQNIDLLNKFLQRNGKNDCIVIQLIITKI